MDLKKTFVCVLCIFAGLACSAQNWEQVKADDSCIWGEGWGSSVEEADQQALASLVSKIALSVVSDFRQVENQVRSSGGDEYYSMQSSRLSSYSSITLTGSQRLVLKTGRKVCVGRWIRKECLEEIFADRKTRIKEYERSAAKAEREGRLDDALRCHFWAYVLLRSLPRPSELCSSDGSILVNSIPESLGTILDNIKVSMVSHIGDNVKLCFTYLGSPVDGLDFSYFDGRRWNQSGSVSFGTSVLEMAPGALAETVQLRIEYAYLSEALMDGELYEIMSVLDLKPLKKSFIFFKT